MSTIEPGTRVRVIVEGTGYPGLDPAEGVSLNTDAGWGFWALITDPAVQVVPVDPERPTLEQVLADHEMTYHGDCECGVPLYRKDGDTYLEHLAEQLRAAGVAL